MGMNEEALRSAKAQLDEEVKKLLAQKVILAWILRRNVEEVSDMEIPDIIACIEGEPEIGTRPVNPGETNTEIAGMANEDSVPGEGKLYYDIIFYVKIPKDNRILKMIIDVEAQKSFYPGYNIETRAVFYSAREISAQKHREFEHSDFDSIKKVYSIWLCLNVPKKIGNAISEYSFKKRDLIPGIPDRREAYDKITIVIVTLNRKTKTEDPFIKLMNTLVSNTLSVTDKKERLENDFGIHVSRDLEERMGIMCNYSDWIEEEAMIKGMEKGLEKGLEKGKILARYEDGMQPEEIAKKMGLTLRQVEDVLLESNVLIMA